MSNSVPVRVLAVLSFLVLPAALTAQHVQKPVNRPPARPAGSNGGVAPKRATNENANEDRIERLESMSPEERRAVLDKLPPDRRERVEKQLNRLGKMTPLQRAKLKERMEKFKSLNPQQQTQVRQISQEIKDLPGPRKAIIRQEMEVLKSLPEGERQSRMESSTWKKQFAPKEQEILTQSTSLLPPPL